MAPTIMTENPLYSGFAATNQEQPDPTGNIEQNPFVVDSDSMAATIIVYGILALCFGFLIGLVLVDMRRNTALAIYKKRSATLAICVCFYSRRPSCSSPARTCRPSGFGSRTCSAARRTSAGRRRAHPSRLIGSLTITLLFCAWGPSQRVLGRK